MFDVPVSYQGEADFGVAIMRVGVLPQTSLVPRYLQVSLISPFLALSASPSTSWQTSPCWPGDQRAVQQHNLIPAHSVQLSFLDHPELEYDLQGAGNIMELPGINGKLRLDLVDFL